MTESIGRKFWELTKSAHLPESPQRLGQPQPPLQAPYDPNAALISLPDPHQLPRPALDLWQVIEQRATLRQYAPEPLSLEELSLLLWATQGVKEVTSRTFTLRTVPSAGARHPFETLLLVNRVRGLEPAVYRYLALEHALIVHDHAPDLSPRLTTACKNQQHVASSAVTFFWVAVPERMTWRYPERGYRYMLLDAGHVCQNLYLVAEGLGCGVCGLAAYEDDLLNQALHLDGERSFVTYAATLGRRGTE